MTVRIPVVSTPDELVTALRRLVIKRRIDEAAAREHGVELNDHWLLREEAVCATKPS